MALALDMDIRTVGDIGKLPDSLPMFLWPEVPLNWETLRIIFPYSVTLAVVGLLESMMTASLVDDLTDTSRNKNREAAGQGVANIVSARGELQPGEPQDVLPALVARRAPALRVMDACGHSRLRQWRLGSTTSTLLRLSDMPVLILR